MADPRHSLGQRAEDYVAASLRRGGYTLRARNWRHPELGEIDIVAQRHDVIVFVEVRARRGPVNAAVEWALASVDARKRARLMALAEAYRAAHDVETDVTWRIDVVAVGVQGGTMAMEVIQGAVGW
jgi:putative endonuclease